MSVARVSVVIPAFNAEAFIIDAIETALDQTSRPAEIIVVDDGSTDGTASLVAALAAPVRLVRSHHAGAGAARNLGLAHATQGLIALLDADDTWAPTKLERQIEAMDEATDVVFCSARNVVDGESTPRAPMRAPLPSALLARREVFRAVGPFDETLSIAEWPDWYLRMTEAGHRVAFVDEALVSRRLHGQNLGIRKREEVGAYARVLKAALDRRRAAEAR